jgi:hypothetical protein
MQKLKAASQRFALGIAPNRESGLFGSVQTKTATTRCRMVAARKRIRLLL